MSDTTSLTSEDSSVLNGSAASFVEVEASGKLSFGLESQQKRLVVQEGLLIALLDESTLLIGDVRPDRSSDDWVLHGRTVLPLPLASVPNGGGGRYLDLALVPSAEKNLIGTLVLLGERKNKERFLASYLVKFSGRSYDIGEESSVFDKSNILGKGISSIAAADHESVFTVSNLVRKIKVEGPEATLKPTTARAQVPNDCLDGILSICGLANGSSSSARKANSKGHHVIIASKTKSAGKNKFAIEWYACNKKDELSLIKGSSLRLHEDSEPVVVINDPRDGRSAFAIYNHRSNGTSTLVKLTRTSATPLANWDFLVSSAAMGWISDNLTIALVKESSSHLHLFAVHKTDGHRSRHPHCNECAGLTKLQSPAHVISMVSCSILSSDSILRIKIIARLRRGGALPVNSSRPACSRTSPRPWPWPLCASTMTVDLPASQTPGALIGSA